MTNHRWKCACCGQVHDELPLCWEAIPPWELLPEDERERRAVYNKDTAIIDSERFFVRGAIELPIVDHPDIFVWSVWVSLSRASWERAAETWDDADRHATTEPFFGWLSSHLPYDPSTFSLKTMVHTRSRGQIPLIELEPTDHPLAIEYREGVTLARVAEIAALMAPH